MNSVKTNTRNLFNYIKSLAQEPIYPLLLAIYPVLFLYNFNIRELTIDVIFIPLLVTLATVTILLLLVNLWLKNWYKTAFIVGIFIAIFFYYQPTVLTLPHSLLTIAGVEITRGKVLLPFVTLLFIVALFSVWKYKMNFLHALTRPLNLLSIVLISLTVFQIGQVEITRAVNRSTATSQNSTTIDGNLAGSLKPDVYYFIFDRYAGQKTLEDFYKYDNSKFYNFLNDKGFYIAKNSHTNYPSTELSIASSLSMDYHQAYDGSGRKPDYTTDIYPKIWDAAAAKQFKELGYTYYQVSSRYMPTSYSNVADKQYIPGKISALNIDEFTFQLLQSSLLNTFGTEMLTGLVNLDYYQAFLNAHKYQRAELPKIIKLDGPKFVFTHILLPHDPHVVDESCRTIDKTQFSMSTDLPAYLDQLQCANLLATMWVDQILSETKGQAIIILQADEGPYPLIHKLPQQKSFSNASDEAIEERTGVLNAYYFPNQDYSQLYENITPVNSFRTVLRQYFNLEIQNLPDKVYVFPSEKQIFEFMDVTDRLDPS